MKMTEHASIRGQQRGIPSLVIDLLLRFGAREHTGRGCEIVYFDKRARKQVNTYAGGLLGKLNGYLDSYVVVTDQVVVTVGQRYKPIRQCH